MIRMPRNHVADETLARIAVAAKRTQRKPAELAPADDELVELPASLMPTKPLDTPPPQPQPQQGAAGDEAGGPELVPPLEESGLDTGIVLHGGDSFDALLGG